MHVGKTKRTIAKEKRRRNLPVELQSNGTKQEKNCWKKTQYANKSTAQEHAPPHLKPYWCPVCGFWHLTSKWSLKTPPPPLTLE